MRRIDVVEGLGVGNVLVSYRREKVEAKVQAGRNACFVGELLVSVGYAYVLGTYNLVKTTF